MAQGGKLKLMLKFRFTDGLRVGGSSPSRGSIFTHAPVAQLVEAAGALKFSPKLNSVRPR